jgi:DNA-binding transcriptional MerR regulator
VRSVDRSVGEVARLAGVSVRTLHHYDEMGLLRPSGRSAAGYRVYGDDDLVRLQHILGYRELGFALDAIAGILDDSELDPVEYLRRQHGLLTDRVGRLQRQLAAIEKTLEARQMGIQLNPEEMFEVFGDFDPTEHDAEVQERWADTDAFRESRRRTPSYTKDDWVRMKADQDEVEVRLLRAMQSGLAPASPEAMDAAEAHRANITRWFYDCDYAIHRGLADMYVADPRFAANYDNRAAGLAAYVRDAIHANADRAATP